MPDTPSSPQLRIPIAIVIGCSLIAIAVYAGLRSSQFRTQPTPTNAATSSVAASVISEPAPAYITPPPAESAPAPPGDQDFVLKVVDAAHNAFEAQDRPIYNKKCWLPALEKLKGGARQAAYVIKFTFDAAGNEKSRTIVPGAMANEELTSCLKGLPVTPLKIAAPGREMTVSVDVFF